MTPFDRPALAPGERRCPDDGRCWHGCGPANAGCFRVACCGPLSGVFPGNTWPAEVRAAENPEGPPTTEQMIARLVTEETSVMTFDRVYELKAWGEGLDPEVFHKLTEFARSIAGDTVKVVVTDVPVADGEVAEFERVKLGYTGSDDPS